MDAPRPARADEFAEVMDFIDLNFRSGWQGRFILQGHYPHLYQNKPEFMRRVILVRDQGSLVGSLAIHPLMLRLDGCYLKTGGIGAVGTHPERRGEGIMSLLLRDAIERMHRDGCALSVLGGDRQRYGWFGWENGGVRNLFTLTLRHLGKPTPAERRLPLQRMEFTGAVCRKLREISRGRPYWVERSPRDIQPLFERHSREVWTCRQGRHFAYLALGGAGLRPRPYERIDEAGGDPELVAAMARVLMVRYRRDRLTAITGPNPEEIELFRPYSSTWTRTTDCMIRIVNLPLLLDGLKKLLQRRARAAGVRGTFCFTMEDAGQTGTLKLGQGPVHQVRLSSRDMVTLFFGVLPVGEVFGPQIAFAKLDRLLPLPLYIPPLNHV